jgi:hypothetical protein
MLVLCHEHTRKIVYVQLISSNYFEKKGQLNDAPITPADHRKSIIAFLATSTDLT